MNIIGWIREGDKAACGGTVVEGDLTCTSHGRAYSFQGAHMACRKNCVIAEGFIRSTLTNGRSQVIHGMVTSGGCPLQSTLNDIDGVGNESGEHVPASFVEHQGEWVEKKFDEQFFFKDENGTILAGIPYTVKLDDELIHGTTDDDGKTERYVTDGAKQIEFHIGHITND